MKEEEIAFNIPDKWQKTKRSETNSIKYIDTWCCSAISVIQNVNFSFLLDLGASVSILRHQMLLLTSWSSQLGGICSHHYHNRTQSSIL